MVVLFFILLSFLCLVVVGVKYDRIVPPISKAVGKRKVNVWYLLIGILFILGSFISLEKEPIFENYVKGILSSDRWGFPVHNRIWFFVYFVCGVLAIISAFSRKSTLNENDINKICIACGQTVKSMENVSCPKCGGDIEDIKGLLPII